MKVLGTSPSSVWDGIKPALANGAADSAVMKIAKSAGRGATDLPFVSDALSVASYGLDVSRDLSRGAQTAPYLVMDAAKDFGSPVAAQMASNGVKALFQSGASTVTDTAATAGVDAAATAGADAAFVGGADVAVGAAAAGALPVVAAGAAAFAVGYEVSNFIAGGEKDWANAVTQGGGTMVDGISHGNWGEVGHGAETMATDVGKGFVDGGEHAWNQTVSDVGGLANGAKNAATSAWKTVSSWF